ADAHAPSSDRSAVETGAGARRGGHGGGDAGRRGGGRGGGRGEGAWGQGAGGCSGRWGGGAWRGGAGGRAGGVRAAGLQGGGAGAGQRLLVHAATGGVGMAAVSIARYLGLEVFGTASPGKRRVLAGMGLDADHVGSSRDASFAGRFAAVTGGAGMDIVLNAL